MHEHGVSENPTDFDDEDSPVGPRPVSAKAVYRLADKLDLPPLKLRAFQHIAGQLTAQNIPAEVFSRFSSTFEDVRKVRFLNLFITLFLLEELFPRGTVSGAYSVLIYDRRSK